MQEMPDFLVKIETKITAFPFEGDTVIPYIVIERD